VIKKFYPAIDSKHFEPLNKEKTAYKITLVPSPEGGYVCPLYDLETTYCGVYAHRPLDCSLWPIMAVKTDDPDVLGIVISSRDSCPDLEKASEAAMKKYTDAVLASLATPRYIEHFRLHPELVWTIEPDWMIPIGTIRLSPKKKPVDS
jgi:Fe-S-cluster containining protein